MKNFIRNWSRRGFIALVVLGSTLALFVVVSPQGRASFQTALFVSQVLELPFKPQAWLTREPMTQEVTYPLAEGTGVADIYRIPDGEQRAGVVIFLGANAAGRNDRDVVNLGNALARAGFVVMFHWSPTMAQQHNIDPLEVENLVWAFQHLQSLDFVDQHRLGLGGFCVGASFALVAAADPRISDDVSFSNAFEPYFDARDLLLQVATRSRMYQGELTPWDPDQLTTRVFANELIETLTEASDQRLLDRLLLQGEDVPAHEIDGLSAEGHRVLRLLQGTTMQEAEDLYQQLPAGFRRSMRDISPSAHIGNVQARLMVMHDRYDRLVPAVESRRLVEALADRGDLHYTELVTFEHVRPGSGGIGQILKEGVKLYRHMYAIIRVAA